MPYRNEVELKYRLEGRANYERLCRGIGEPAADWEQINHYFRSADGKIPGEQGVIRIRLERGEAVFTVKLGGPLKDGLASAQEYEEPWSGDLQERSLRSSTLWETGHAGLKVLEQEFGQHFPLVWAGKMVNRRRLYRLPEGLCLEVDASRYPDGAEDYEVEVETQRPEQDRARLTRLLDSLGIRYAPQTATKYQRFLLHIPQT
jgi:uncharacterized protein YjbK